MTTDTRERILEYIKKNQQASPKQLADFLGIGAPALHRQLNKLVEQKQIQKVGKSPRVFYILSSKPEIENYISELGGGERNIIQEKYYRITSSGRILSGVEGFIDWCIDQKLPIEKTAKEYVKTIDKYEIYKKSGLIDGLPKLKSTFEKVWVDKMYYLDFYSIERFGKTKFGTMLLYAKQSQNRKLMRDLTLLIRPKVLKLIEDNNIDAVAFIPPTIKRNIQFMSELERGLDLRVKSLNLVKASGEVAVAQKTLSKLPERVENARSTIFYNDTSLPSKVLLIDDAMGSGASINEVAGKIKKASPKTKIIGLVITGSFKGFEVLNEV